MLFVSASHLLCKLAEHQSAISRNFTEEKLIEVFNTRPSRFFKTNEWFFKALKDLIKNSGCSIFGKLAWSTHKLDKKSLSRNIKLLFSREEGEINFGLKCSQSRESSFNASYQESEDESEDDEPANHDAPRART